MVTGRISLRAPEYSPISSSVSEVRLSSSSRHCRAETVLVTRIRVVGLGQRHGPGADEGLAGAAGQHDDARTRRARTRRPPAAGRAAATSPSLSRSIGVRLAVDVAGLVLGRPADLEQLLLEVAALGGVHDDAVGVDAARPISGLIFLCRNTSSSTGRSVVRSTQAVLGVLLEGAAGRSGPSCRRRRRAGRAARHTG